MSNPKAPDSLIKRFTLKRESLVALTDDELEIVNGGSLRPTPGGPPLDDPIDAANGDGGGTEVADGGGVGGDDGGGDGGGGDGGGGGGGDGGGGDGGGGDGGGGDGGDGGGGGGGGGGDGGGGDGGGGDGGGGDGG